MDLPTTTVGDEIIRDLTNVKTVGADALLGIKYVYASNKKLIAELPVRKELTQPMGILHGGINVVLAESVASVASNLNTPDPAITFLGLEINANHLRPGIVGDTLIATATPIHIGKTSQVWDVKIHSKTNGKITCVSRCTTQGVPRQTVLARDKQYKEQQAKLQQSSLSSSSASTTEGVEYIPAKL